MKRKNLAIGAITVIVMAVAAGGVVYASPYWAIHVMKQAAIDRDVDELMARVDEPALRKSVQLALGFRLGEMLQENRGEGTRKPLPEEAQRNVASQAEPMVDALTSSTLLIAMIREGRPSQALGRFAAPSRPSADTSPAGWSTEPRYLDSSTVEVHPKGAADAGAFVLRRSGILGWKLSGLRWPGA